MRTEELHGIRVLFLDPEGETIATSEQTSDLIGNAWYDHAELIAVPVARLDPEFFRLSSGVAGEVTQKLVNYRLRLAVLGDVTAATEASSALRDYIWESNRGEHIWFLDDEAALVAKLEARRPHPN